MASARRPSLWRQDRTAYLFLLPWLLGFFCLTLGPMVYSFYLSLTKFNLLNSPRWLGLQNYVQIFTDDASFLQSLKITFQYVLLSVPLRLIFALLVAMALNKGIRALGIYRTVYYIPSLLGGSVAIAIVWKKIFDGDGLFNHFLATFGIEGPAWIANPLYVLYTIVTLSVWQFGSAMVIFLAGLKQIPADLYEASEVDGAGKVRQFFRITLPLLSPVLFFNLVMSIINSFQVFTPGYVIGDGRGGPIDSTLFYTLYLYLKGFSFFDMGYASALAWIMLAIIGAFTALVFVTSKYWVFYGDGKEERG
ncbi:carbohydrate ABC transporter permease [Paenibacillus mucilaginosus]|uniref:YesP n=3 Tax=Paenibacillus mucilaginosus TaxID=61624 RepID=H6NL15_9BACL|nr:sugar ABC transporter permease [Paenibacillus mucilaginosus]AEI40711.1 YesP [Paenibacillus mucilaginosus KNP414]AFC29321.1 YesP [Paenibacillus mucilaginosus 3016]AFH61499.1 ABC transporter permease [Paenibacillus mucilaginosus K02]MCG7211806.1 sugar ABC transporter permease [Paenibacillus mucilaginosus]WDM29844.1 sugar ABC transporter permease [Paenibacillus mucilaginosus]